MKDNLFQNEITQKFSFDEAVASVFDDMLPRSVPLYRENIALIAALLAKRNPKSIADLGCSSGNLLLSLAQKLPNARLTGIDSSSAMIALATSKAKAYGAKIDFVVGDILEAKLDSEVLIANYTLQFIRPPRRESFAQKIFESLPMGGVFVLSEKLAAPSAWLDKALIDIYHDFKAQNGYSATEIAKKREALENILIPYTQDENIALLKKAGFAVVEVLLRFCNFATFVAIKEQK